MMRTTSPSSLTLENLKRLSISVEPFYHTYPSQSSPTTSSSDDDNASVFSANSAHSSVESAPDDEEPPRTVADQNGVPVLVYSSLDQAVRYSLMRVAAQQREQEAAQSSSGWGSGPRFLTVGSFPSSTAAVSGSVTAPVLTLSAPFYGGEDEVEDVWMS